MSCIYGIPSFQNHFVVYCISSVELGIIGMFAVGPAFRKAGMRRTTDRNLQRENHPCPPGKGGVVKRSKRRGEREIKEGRRERKNKKKERKGEGKKESFIGNKDI